MKYNVYDLKLKHKEKKYLLDAINKNQVTSGKYIDYFQNEFKKICNSKYTIAVSNGTNALHLCCKAIGLKDGDEVLVSSSTNMASAFAISYCGAIPIPIDVKKNTWQINPDLIEDKITKRTKAIMIVHLFGQAVEIDEIKRISNKYKLKIIEDCAEAHGVFYKKKHVGNFGDVAAYSFYFNKSITSGEGGMICTNSKKIFNYAKNYRNLCYGFKDRFLHTGIGYNYRLSNLHSALGYGIAKNFKEIIKIKNKIYSTYTNELSNIEGIEIPKISINTTKYIMWVYNILINKNFNMSRDELMLKLRKAGIETRKAFAPINQQNIYTSMFKKKIFKNSCKNANYIMNNGLYLPSGNNLKKKDIMYICNKIRLISKS
ncbi:DegT/DnrJ/EryC1/StrS family aminotransferase [Candidatus Pelagibacter ubique]|jgi:perosamine synthetase|nr:DegT/DnrJ/EryC1/StrS family aminotransferase [Candidatus Pelagibacter ubique]